MSVKRDRSSRLFDLQSHLTNSYVTLSNTILEMNKLYISSITGCKSKRTADTIHDAFVLRDAELNKRQQSPTVGVSFFGNMEIQ